MLNSATLMIHHLWKVGTVWVIFSWKVFLYYIQDTLWVLIFIFRNYMLKYNSHDSDDLELQKVTHWLEVRLSTLEEHLRITWGNTWAALEDGLSNTWGTLEETLEQHLRMDWALFKILLEVTWATLAYLRRVQLSLN